LGFRIEPTKNAVLLSFGVVSLISLPVYLKEQKWKETLKVWRGSLPMLVIFLVLFPLVFIQASRPPVEWDEMAYHFISPQSLYNLSQFWSFNGYLYMDVPRSLDIFYILNFSAIRTYSMARLVNFMFLLTGVAYAYNFLKEKFSLLSALFFTLAILSVPQTLVKHSTSGYVDMPANALVLMVFVTGVVFVLKPNKKELLLIVLLASISAGIKYTVLMPLLPLVLIIFIVILFKKGSYKDYLNKKLIINALIIAIVFGGYWYIKNYYFYENPVFPFLFDCKSPFGDACARGSSFFGSWTTKVSFETVLPILRELLVDNVPLAVLTLLLPIWALFSKNSETRKTFILLGTAVVLEFLALAKFSGFHFRYHQHLQFIIIFLVSTQLANRYSSQTFNRIAKFVIALATMLLIPYFIYATYYNYYHVSFRQETKYALGMVDIYQWIEWRMPKVVEFAKWCSEQDQTVKVVQHDPDMIWYSYDGLVRVFLVNCQLTGLPLGDKTVDETRKLIVEDDLKFYLISPNECVGEDEVKKKNDFETDERFLMRKRNNMMVCSGEKVVDSLYYIDP
jgi:hypothetical protein